MLAKGNGTSVNNRRFVNQVVLWRNIRYRLFAMLGATPSRQGDCPGTWRAKTVAMRLLIASDKDAKANMASHEKG